MSLFFIKTLQCLILLSGIEQTLAQGPTLVVRDNNATYINNYPPIEEVKSCYELPKCCNSNEVFRYIQCHIEDNGLSKSVLDALVIREANRINSACIVEVDPQTCSQLIGNITWVDDIPGTPPNPGTPCNPQSPNFEQFGKEIASLVGIIVAIGYFRSPINIVIYEICMVIDVFGCQGSLMARMAKESQITGYNYAGDNTLGIAWQVCELSVDKYLSPDELFGFNSNPSTKLITASEACSLVMHSLFMRTAVKLEIFRSYCYFRALTCNYYYGDKLREGLIKKSLQEIRWWVPFLSLMTIVPFTPIPYTGYYSLSSTVSLRRIIERKRLIIIDGKDPKDNNHSTSEAV